MLIPSQAVAVLVRPGAGNAHGSSKAAVCVTPSGGASGLHAGDACLKSGELSPVAPVQRCFADGGGTDVATGRRRSPARSGGGRSHHLFGVPRLHHDVENELGSHRHGEPVRTCVTNPGAEALIS
jgi:hypothetical protein